MGSAAVLISAGGAWTDAGGLNLGGAGTGSGTLQVAGGMLNTSGFLTLGGEAGGAGSLTISAGGTVIDAALPAGGGVFVGGYTGDATGDMVVSGAGSLFKAHIFGIGAGGAGTVAITDGGAAVVDAFAVGAASASSITIASGGVLHCAVFASVAGNGAAALAGGTLIADGNLTVAAGGAVSGWGLISGNLALAGSIAASGGTLSLTQPLSGTGTLSIQAGSELSLSGSVAANVPVQFTAGSGERLDLAAPASFGGSVSGFLPGDTIFAAGAMTISVNGGQTVTLFDANQIQIGTIALSSAIADGTLVDNNGNITYACFAAGTHIATPRDSVPVEALRAGDTVMTAFGAQADVKWVGYRHVACNRHPRPGDVWPVRIVAGAFGPGRPARDLWLSPDHAVFTDGVLIPIRYLINGRTIRQERRAEVTYFHVELASHDVLLAEGLPCESYLDTGNRSAFANGCAALELHPDFARRIWRERACAKLVLNGPPLVAARAATLAHALNLGFNLTGDPALEVRADGRSVDVRRYGKYWIARLPLCAARVALISRCWIPAETRADETDTRVLGVALSRVWLDRQEVGLADARFLEGWHDIEPGWRWTNGGAVVTPNGAREFEFELAMTGSYWLDKPLRAAI